MKLLFQKVYDQPYLLLLLATSFWAGNAIAGKLAVGHVSPFALTFLRWLVVMMLLSVFARDRIKQDWQKIRPHLIYLFILGSIGFALFNNLMYFALTKTSAVNSVIIQSSLPLFIFIFNFILFRVSANRYQIIGLPISVLGVVLITTQGKWEVLLSFGFNIGDLLMIVAVVAYGLYSALLKNKPSLHWLSFIAVLSFAAFITSLPFLAWEIAAESVIWPDLSGCLIVIYTAVFASLASQSFWIRSVELIGSNATGIFINLVPLLGTLMAIIVLGENFRTFHLFGMVLIFGGVWLAQLNNRSNAR